MEILFLQYGPFLLNWFPHDFCCEGPVFHALQRIGILWPFFVGTWVIAIWLLVRERVLAV